jgi:hypothetical protein
MKKDKSAGILRKASFALAFSLLLVGSSCDKEPEGKRPDLPPVESLIMNFSDFDSPVADVKSSVESHNNFNHAFTSLVFWSGASAFTVALPVTAYGYALEQEAVYLGDNRWEWSYEFQWNSMDFRATLTGERMNNEEFSLEMLIAPAAFPEQGVRWFDGIVRYDHTHATWNIYREGTVEVLGIEWSKDFELGDASLQYTYTEPDQEETGSYIRYEYNPAEPYDASFTVSLLAGTTLIQWDTASKEGRVEDEVKFGDDAWHCWDSLENGLADKSCE